VRTILAAYEAGAGPELYSVEPTMVCRVKGLALGPEADRASEALVGRLDAEGFLRGGEGEGEVRRGWDAIRAAWPELEGEW
jgi:hypothetical protein